MIDLKDKFDDMGIDELLIYIITINVTGCKQVEANNAAVQIRQQFEKRIDSLVKQYEDDLNDTPDDSLYRQWSMGRLNGFYKVKKMLK